MYKRQVLLSAILLTAALSACSSRQASPEPSEDPKATVEHMTTDCSAEAPSASGPAEESSSSIPAEVPSDASDRTGRFLKSTSGDGILVIDNYGPVVFTYALSLIHILEIDEYITYSKSYGDLFSYLKFFVEQLMQNASLCNTSGQSDSARMAADIQEYIEKNYAANININDIATAFSLTPAYFSRMFKKYTGTRPCLLYTSMPLAGTVM